MLKIASNRTALIGLSTPGRAPASGEGQADRLGERHRMGLTHLLRAYVHLPARR